MRPFRFTLLFLLTALSILLAACASPAPTLAPSATAPRVTDTAAPTDTPAPTATLRPSLTPQVATATVTQTAGPSATVPPTLDAALTSVKLIGLGWYTNYDLLLSFQFPSKVDPSKYRVTMEDKEYKCEVLAKYPNRLYCRGQGAKVLATAWVRLYQVGSDQPGFEKNVWVPYFTD